jgi:hypothetical protein
MRSKIVKLLVVLAVVAVMATSVVLLAACGGMTTKHSGNTVTGSFTAVETEFEYINPTAWRALNVAWNDTDAADRSEANFILSLSGGTPTETSRATHRRQHRSVDMFGDTIWGTHWIDGSNQVVERTVGQGFFATQTRLVAISRGASDNLGSVASVASALGLQDVTSVATLNSQLRDRWNAEGLYAPATVTVENTNNQRITNRLALSTALTNLLVSEDDKALGYYWVSNLTTGEGFNLSLSNPITFSQATVGETTVVVFEADQTLTRFIQQKVTRVHTYFATASVDGPTSVDRSAPMSWNADGTDLTVGTVTIIHGEDDHQLRPIVTTRSVLQMYDRGTDSNIMASVTYVNGQVFTMSVLNSSGDMSQIQFIINKP